MTASGAALRLLAGKMEVCFGASEVLWVKSHKAEVLSLTAVLQPERDCRRGTKIRPSSLLLLDVWVVTFPVHLKEQIVT